MSFARDLLGRLALLAGALIVSIPLVSLFSAGSAPAVLVAACVALIVVSAIRPHWGVSSVVAILAVASVFPSITHTGLAPSQIAEAAVLAFVVGAVARAAADGQVFARARTARPALVLLVIVAASGLCALLGLFVRPGDVADAVWRAIPTYFSDAESPDVLQPTMNWLELVALVPLVELAVRRQRRWRGVLAAFVLATVLVSIGVRVAGHAQTLATPSSSPPRTAAFAAAMKVVSQAPVFGAGMGQYGSSEDLADVLPQVGLVGLAACAWMLASAGELSTRAVDRLAPQAALALIVVAAAVRPTLVSFPVVLAAAVGVGIAAAAAPAPGSAPPPTSVVSRRVFLAAIAVVLVCLPFRIAAVFAFSEPQVTGAGPVQPDLENVAYRVAERDSTWRLRAGTRTVILPMRWSTQGQADCLVTILVRGRADEQIKLRQDAWTNVRFAIPQESATAPEVRLHTTSPTCQLFVGAPIALH